MATVRAMVADAAAPPIDNTNSPHADMSHIEKLARLFESYATPSHAYVNAQKQGNRNVNYEEMKVTVKKKAFCRLFLHCDALFERQLSMDDNGNIGQRR